MAQVARAQTEAAGGDPRSLRRLSVQFRGMGVPEEEIVVTGTVTEPRRRPGDHRDRGGPGRQRDRPQRRGRSSSCAEAAGPGGGALPGLPRIHGVLSERQELILEIAVDAYLKTGTPVGSKAIAERSDFDWGASTVRAELASARARGLPHPAPHVRRPDPDRRRISPLRRQPDRVGSATGAGTADRRPSDSPRPAARSRTRSARRPRPSPRRTTCSRSRRRRRSARRRSTGSRSCCCSRGSSRSSRSPTTATSQSASSRSGRRSIRASSSGLRRSSTSASPASGSARAWSRPRLQDPALGEREREFLERDRRRGRRARRGDAAAALHGRDRAAALGEPRRRHPPSRRRRQRPRGTGQRPLGAAHGAPRALRLPLHRRGEPGAGAALGQRRRRRLRPRLPQPRRRRRRRARCGWTTRKAIDSVRDAAGELSRLFATVYEG